jgi:hypothetical protein
MDFDGREGFFCVSCRPNILDQRRKVGLKQNFVFMIQNSLVNGGYSRQNAIIFFTMPNIHQIHINIGESKCKYFFTEK